MQILFALLMWLINIKYASNMLKDDKVMELDNWVLLLSRQLRQQEEKC